MKYLYYYMLLQLFILITGCATQGSLDTVHNDIDAISTRLFTLEKDLGNLQEESAKYQKSLEKNYRSEDATLHKTLADLQANIDSAGLEMQAQSAKLDDLTQATKKPIEELQRYHDDADKRVLVLEDHIIKLQAAVDGLNKTVGELAQQKVVTLTPDSLYMQGLEIFKSGDMAKARESFQNFLDLYPQHNLAANAVFWIGESYYSENNYEQAILKYQDVIEKYHLKEKIPAAMLKQAMAFSAIKDAKSARFILKQLTTSFPKSEEAKLGKELLKKIR